MGWPLARVSRSGISASGTLGLLPPPLWGRAGEGGDTYINVAAMISRPPPPTPPHKGEGSAPRARSRRASTSSKRALVREQRVPKGQQTVKVESLHRLYGAPILDAPRERGQAHGVQRRDDRGMQERQVAEPIAQPIIANRGLWIDVL